jgi:hypothetical protein
MHEFYMHQGGAVLRHGGIIGRIDKIYADLNCEDGSAV